MNIRKIVDTWSGLANGNAPVKTDLKAGDQVVVKRTMGVGRLASKEVMAGTLISFADGGRNAVVSIPRAGGRQLRSTVPVAQLSAVSEVFRRARVQFNPAFRGSV